MSGMGRRQFVALLGGAPVAWPLAARAQQPERRRRIGVLMNRTADNPEGQTRFAGFLQGLQEAGWAVGRNVRIDIRWGIDDVDRQRKYAAELAALVPDIILASGTLSLAAMQQASRSVPIVFAAVADPVGGGFVDSLARPGGNVTGFLLFEYSLSGKWLELLKQIAPRVTRAAVLRNATNPAGNAQFAAIQAVAPSTVAMSSLAIALGVAAWLLPMRGEQATAQSGPLRILVVEYDIVPAEIDKYLTAIKELGAAAVKDHVLLFEAWDNAAAFDAFLATDLFKKYQATVGNMIAKRDIRTYSSVAMNFKGN